MTTLSELLIRLDLQAESDIDNMSSRLFTYECVKLKCEVCDLWIVYRYYYETGIAPDFWIVSTMPTGFNRNLLNHDCLFGSTQSGIDDLVLHYHKWAPHGLDHAVLQEIFSR